MNVGADIPIFAREQKTVGKIMLTSMIIVLGVITFLISYLWPSAQNAKALADTPAPESALESERVDAAMMSPQIIDQMRQMVKPVSPPMRPQSSPQEAPALTQERPPAVLRHTYREKKKGLALDRPGGETAAPDGADQAQEGVIPELSVDLSGMSPEQVADHFGFALVVQSYKDKALLCKITDRRIEPLPGLELGRYATRGRSARGIENEFMLRRRIAEALDRTFDDIGLIYLVPKSIDQIWINWQKMTIKRTGYVMKDVSRVEARYRMDFSLQGLALILKSGQRIPLEAASL